MLAGLLVMLGMAILRRLWQVWRSQSHLAVFALCAFADAGVTLVLAARLARGALSVGAVARTRGRDISHAMEAIRSLRETFGVLRAAMIAAPALVAVAPVGAPHHRLSDVVASSVGVAGRPVAFIVLEGSCCR